MHAYTLHKHTCFYPLNPTQSKPNFSRKDEFRLLFSNHPSRPLASGNNCNVFAVDRRRLTGSVLENI